MMKTLLALMIMSLALLSACKDHTIAPATSEISLEKMRNMRSGSYLIYASEGPFSTIETDSFVCAGNDATITKDGQKSVVLVQFDNSRAPIDTLFWVINDHQIWEYNRHYFQGLDTSCECKHVPYMKWRLVYDTKNDDAQVHHLVTDIQTLPTLVVTKSGLDSIVDLTFATRADVGMYSNGFIAPNYPATIPAVEAKTMRPCKSGVDFQMNRLTPYGIKLKSSNDSLAFVRDSVEFAMAPNVDAVYMMRRWRMVNISDMLSTIGARQWLVRYNIKP